jgi:ferredoxin
LPGEPGGGFELETVVVVDLEVAPDVDEEVVVVVVVVVVPEQTWVTDSTVRSAGTIEDSGTPTGTVNVSPPIVETRNTQPDAPTAGESTTAPRPNASEPVATATPNSFLLLNTAVPISRLPAGPSVSCRVLPHGLQLTCCVYPHNKDQTTCMLTLYAQIREGCRRLSQTRRGGAPMKIVVDVDACAAHGDCVVAAPEIFDLGDDDEVVTVLRPEPGDELRSSAQAAVDACPMAAIRIEG